MPDVILVRKYYANKGERKWMLKNFEGDVNEAAKLSAKEQEAMEEDYEEFLQTVEADKSMRKNMRLYRSGAAERDGPHETRSQKRAAGPSSKRSRVDSGAAGEGRVDDGDGGAFDALRGDDSDDEFVRLEELIDDMALSFDVGSGELMTKEEAGATPALDLGGDYK